MCLAAPEYATDIRCVCDFAFSFCWWEGVLVGFLCIGFCFYAGLLGVWVWWGVLCVVLVVFGWGQPLGPSATWGVVYLAFGCSFSMRP